MTVYRLTIKIKNKDVHKQLFFKSKERAEEVLKVKLKSFYDVFGADQFLDWSIDSVELVDDND